MGRKQLRHVLIVEDDPDQAMAMKIIFEANGFEVSLAHNAAHAIMEATRKLPDAVILDIGLPGHSGIEIMHTFAKYPNFAELPVFVVTANEDQNVRVQAFDSGAKGFYQKPFDYRTLIQNIQSL